MSIRAVAPSLSPSMDIGVSSNFERLLFELLDRDAGRTASIMTGFPPYRPHGGARRLRGKPRDPSSAPTGSLDERTLDEIRRTYRETGYLADPHTATAIAAARAEPDDGTPMVIAATAHPAKFPDAIERAVGFRPPLPPHLADLYDRPEIFTEAENDLAAIQAQLRAFVSRNAA